MTPLNVTDISKHFTVRHISCVFGEKSGASAAFLLDWPQHQEKYMEKNGNARRKGKLSLNGTPCVTTSAFCKLSYIEKENTNAYFLPSRSSHFLWSCRRWETLFYSGQCFGFSTKSECFSLTQTNINFN